MSWFFFYDRIWPTQTTILMVTEQDRQFNLLNIYIEKRCTS